MKVILLEKPEGQSWSPTEMSELKKRSRVEIQSLGGKPHRLAVMSMPLGEPIAVVLRGVQFTAREVSYSERWS